VRPKLNTRKARLAYAGAGVSALAIPAAAAALNSPSSTAAPASVAPVPASTALHVNLSRHRLGYGERLAVTGNASPAAAGRRMLLQFSSAAGSRWRSLAATRVAPSGHFRLVAPVRRSGVVRVMYAGAGAPGSPALTANAFAPGSLSAGITSASVPQRVRVAASLQVPAGALNVLSGQAVELRGRLLPGIAGRVVRLQARTGHRWQTLARARTGAAGRFRLHYGAAGLGRRALRVRFTGDRLNTRVSRPVGQVTVYRSSVASWYEDAGATACGFHAYFGVANRYLPCGTAVTFNAGGRTVTAIVDDRGPFVGGREWDLNQNTAAALGFGGVGAVWSSV